MGFVGLLVAGVVKFTAEAQRSRRDAEMRETQESRARGETRSSWGGGELRGEFAASGREVARLGMGSLALACGLKPTASVLDRYAVRAGGMADSPHAREQTVRGSWCRGGRPPDAGNSGIGSNSRPSCGMLRGHGRIGDRRSSWRRQGDGDLGRGKAGEKMKPRGRREVSRQGICDIACDVGGSSS